MPVRLFSAGSNARGQLGQAHLEDSHSFQACLFEHHSLNAVTSLPVDSIVSVSCGANHTLLLTEREEHGKTVRELWGCGDGRKGQLGPSISEEARSPRNNQVSSIFRHIGPDILTAAGLSDDDVSIQHVAASWESTILTLRPRNINEYRFRDILISLGSNEYGDLGIGLPPSQLGLSAQPQQIDIDIPLTRAYSDRFIGFNVIKMVAGPHHIIVIIEVSLTDGKKDVLLMGWGSSRYGQLGGIPKEGPSKLKGNHKTLSTPLSFTPEPHVISMGTKYDQGDKVIDVALGNTHTVVLCSSGKVIGLGSNKKGQLEGTNKIMQVKLVGSTWNGSYLVQEKNIVSDLNSNCWDIYAMGAGDKGQLGHLEDESCATVTFPFTPVSHRFTSLACGSEHTLCLLKRNSSEDSDGLGEGNAEVWGWGWNEHGNLGLGHTADVYQPSLIWPGGDVDLPPSNVINIWGGCGTSWLLLQCNI